jgi:hypothetical protein
MRACLPLCALLAAGVLAGCSGSIQGRHDGAPADAGAAHDGLAGHDDGGCGVGMTLAPTSWGTLLRTGLATAW